MRWQILILKEYYVLEIVVLKTFCIRYKMRIIFYFLSLGPGLAIRVICAEEPYICKDFPETNNILKIVADFSASVKKVII